MTLTDRLAGPPPYGAKGPACGVGNLPKDLRTALVDAHGRGWSITRLAAELRGDGIDIRSHTLGRHFRGDCSCPR